MAHLWQRFLLASALIFGLALGVAATVFGYSNLQTVDIHWSVFQLNGVPLWTVGIVPVALILVAGTVYHWIDGLHHFSEHMRHRHRVRELETEITRLREHLDHVLEMPRGDKSQPAPAAEALEPVETPSLPAADMDDELKPEPEPVDTAEEKAHDEEPKKPVSDKKKRSRIIMETEPEPAAAKTNGAESEPALSSTKEG